jgi:hypothetical protein
MSTHTSRSTHKSTLGRPRALTDAQIADILAWHAKRQTLIQKAAEHGVSPTVIRQVIRTGGKTYKQPSPEQRAANLAADRQRRHRRPQEDSTTGIDPHNQASLLAKPHSPRAAP